MLKLCDDIDTLSMMLCDGELAEQELRDVELHLLDCATCRHQVEREREVVGLLRDRLAAPPAPALVRQRLTAALDQEDRSRRGSWWRSLALPGAAMAAAAAALLVFAFGSSTPAPRGDAPIAGTPLRAVAPAGRVGFGGSMAASSISDVGLTLAGVERLGEDVAALYYAAVAPSGERFDVQVTVHDAARLGLDARGRTIVGGYEVWDGAGGLVVRDGPRAIRITSRTLGTDDLKRLIGGTPLVARVGADDPRR
ncbi:MAG: hypothetical protein R3B06_06465 [Kofleriaceae bacterium]